MVFPVAVLWWGQQRMRPLHGRDHEAAWTQRGARDLHRGPVSERWARQGSGGRTSLEAPSAAGEVPGAGTLSRGRAGAGHVHPVTGSTGEDLRRGTDVRPVTGTTVQRPPGASRDTTSLGAGSPTATVTTR